MKEDTATTIILSPNLFPVIGIGASAGGLNAFKELIKVIPENSGMAYIFIQHLAPDHDSLLTEILQKITTLPVIEITDNVTVLPDHIYVIPENKSLIANDGVLELNALIKGERSNTIDVFFTSLAEVHQSYAIGILLSGNGSDGTVGLKTIKDVGGYTIAQDTTATYAAMPQSAIEAGVVDFVMPPKAIPAFLKELVRTAQIAPSNFNNSKSVVEDEVFRQIIVILKTKKDIDFTYYKQTTIRRRILRRKALNRIEKLEDYQQYLIENKAEQDALYKDILIPVTAFFRDPDTFNFLYETILPVLFKEKSASESVRIWIAGCATGEEAYSMAICLYEYFIDKPALGGIQIFATDVSEVTIAKARSGIYPKNDLAGVSATRLKQFFTKTDGSYQVNKAIREMVVFARQDFLKDPPFAKLDLISCRNVLIYMQPYLQQKAFAIFHYALHSKGMLLLGKSESIGTSQQFSLFKEKDKFYVKMPFAGRYMPMTTKANTTAIEKQDSSYNLTGKKDDFQKAAEDALLVKYNPVGVIVNDQLDIVQFRGSTNNFLEASSGRPSHNILKMAKDGLSFELRNLFHKVKKTKKAAKKEGIFLDKENRKVSIEVIPLDNTIESYFLVLFEDSIEPVKLKNQIKNRSLSGEKNVNKNPAVIRSKQLEEELAQTREDVRSITEEQEAANEELQSANEELLSGSEELQTLNEELETSKEEIQSSNEELSILNQELIERNEQLIHARKYAEAIIVTIHEPLIILTKDLRIKSANKSFYETFNSTEQQTEGKAFFEWQGGIWNVPELKERLEKVLPQHSYFRDFEMSVKHIAIGERCLLLNGRQLINDASDEELILFAMEDITARKELERSQKLFTKELESQVLERTQELSEANIHLQYSNDNLRQFASIASHDLQEPLRKIKTFASILNRSYLKDINEEGKEVISKMSSSADRMSTLIREVLEYTKVAQVDKHFERTDLDSILMKVIDDHDMSIAENGATIIYEKPLPSISAIPLQMNQLIHNLLGNALKFYRPETPPVISVSYKMIAGDEANKAYKLNAELSYVEIQVSDNGIGFEQEFEDQIFQIFERLHSVTEFEGTGIGLALCKKIVENHDGYIHAISKENESTSFFVILPVNH